jgi:hypothetical protein
MDHGMREATVAVADEEMLAAIQARQRDARYPMLLAIAPREDGVIFHRIREGTGLVTVAIRHGSLTPDQHTALGEFRLQQYLLCGWYDHDAVMAHSATQDPAFDVMAADTMHIVVGSQDNILLAYFCIQPAGRSFPDHSGWQAGLRVYPNPSPRGRPRMCHPSRTLFPSEVELFGPHLFSALPAVRDVPVDHVRELSCLLRNRTHQSPLAATAIVEAIYTLCHLKTRPESPIRIVIGNADLAARRVIGHLGLPFLYAPLAPVMKPQHDSLWSDVVNVQGNFWPFVLAIADARAHPEHFRTLDAVLSLPTDQIRRALVDFRRSREAIVPRTLLRDVDSSLVLWTADPLYGIGKLDRVGAATRQPALVWGGEQG